jgi:hypothetical protein
LELIWGRRHGLNESGEYIKKRYLARQEETPVIVELKNCGKRAKTTVKQKADCWKSRFIQHSDI